MVARTDPAHSQELARLVALFGGATGLHKCMHVLRCYLRSVHDDGAQSWHEWMPCVIHSVATPLPLPPCDGGIVTRV